MKPAHLRLPSFNFRYAVFAAACACAAFLGGAKGRGGASSPAGGLTAFGHERQGVLRLSLFRRNLAQQLPVAGGDGGWWA